MWTGIGLTDKGAVMPRHAMSRLYERTTGITQPHTLLISAANGGGAAFRGNRLATHDLLLFTLFFARLQ